MTKFGRHIFKPCVDWLLKSVPVISPFGRSALKKTVEEPEADLSHLRSVLHELEKVVAFFAKDTSLFHAAADVFAGFRDIRGTLANIELKQILDEVELFEVKTFALQMEKLAAIYNDSGLKLKNLKFVSLEKVVKLLNPDELTTSSFYLHSDYSQGLANIRQQKNEIEKRMAATDDQQTVSELRKERSQIVAGEKQEEYKARLWLSEQLQRFHKDLCHNMIAAGQLELVMAKAILARRWPACKPEFSDKLNFADIKLKEGINPEISEVLEARGKKFTPVTIDLQKGVTVLTGANMGGKTVALKTVAFNAQLARLGFYAFAEQMHLPLLDFICVVGGDGQDQLAGLSSFGAEILGFSHTVKLFARGTGLVVFDEFARSTNPFEGSRFVLALCRFLQTQQVYGLIATHYDGVNLAGASYYQVMGLKQHDLQTTKIEDDPEKLLERLCQNMDYRLQKIDQNYQVPRDALHIARLLQTDESFLAILQKYYE
jgi:dsDNA-specific endonuclease/ATPase MutS2